jgi:hypothetical protein
MVRVKNRAKSMGTTAHHTNLCEQDFNKNIFQKNGSDRRTDVASLFSVNRALTPRQCERSRRRVPLLLTDLEFCQKQRARTYWGTEN